MSIEGSMREMAVLLQAMKSEKCPGVLLKEISLFENYILRISKLSELIAGLPKVERGQEFSPDVQAKVYPIIYEMMKESIPVPMLLKMAFDKVVLSANAAIKDQNRFVTFKESVAIFNKQCAESIAANTGEMYKQMYLKYKKKEISKEEFKKLKKELRATLVQTRKLGIRWGKPGKKLYLETVLGTVMTLKVLLGWSVFMSTLNSFLYGGIVTVTMGAAFGPVAIPAYFLGQMVYQYVRGLIVMQGSLEALGRYKVYSIM